MKLERGCVYGTGRGSYLLVFNTSKFGASFAYCCNTAGEAYNELPELKINDSIGSVCFDRIVYVPWTKLSTRGYQLVKKLSQRQYNLIVNAVSNLYLGLIEYQGKSLEYVEHMHITATEAIPENNEHKDEKSVEIHVERKVDSIEFKNPNADIIAAAEVAGIPTCDTSSSGSSGETKYFDLLETVGRVNTSIGGSRASTGVARIANSKKENRRFFSEIETLEIASSNIRQIMHKYEVSHSVASTMLQNAKKAFNGSDKKTRRNSVTPKTCFDSGMTVEEACAACDESPYKVRQYYTEHGMDKDNSKAREKWDRIIAEGDMESIKSALGLTINQFCINEKCSSSTANEILIKLNRLLVLDPYYTVFGLQAFESDFHESMQTCKYKRDRINHEVYLMVRECAPYYQKYFNFHHDIMMGSKDIGDVPNEIKGFLLAMIFNRFNPKVTLPASRVLTREQQKALSSLDVLEVAKAFAIRCEKARGIVSNRRSV